MAFRFMENNTRAAAGLGKADAAQTGICWWSLTCTTRIRKSEPFHESQKSSQKVHFQQASMNQSTEPRGRVQPRNLKFT